MKLLYGTGNPAKLSVMQERLAGLGIEVIGLTEFADRGKEILQVMEDGSTPLENARQKAWAYYEAFHMPVFSCDSGLYFEELPAEKQPGIHVRTVNGVYLNDQQMIEHYTGLVKEYGVLTEGCANMEKEYKVLTGYYTNGICLILDEKHCYEEMSPALESERFWITDRPHSRIRKKGFPIDSLSVDKKTGKYYYDLKEEELTRFAVEDGFLTFFQKVFSNI